MGKLTVLEGSNSSHPMTSGDLFKPNSWYRPPPRISSSWIGRRLMNKCPEFMANFAKVFVVLGVPLPTKARLSENLRKLHFLVLFFFSNITILPSQWLLITFDRKFCWQFSKGKFDVKLKYIENMHFWGKRSLVHLSDFTMFLKPQLKNTLFVVAGLLIPGLLVTQFVMPVIRSRTTVVRKTYFRRGNVVFERWTWGR